MRLIITGVVGVVAGFCAGVQSVPPATLTLGSGSIVRNFSARDIAIKVEPGTRQVRVENGEMSFTPGWLFAQDCFICSYGGEDQTFVGNTLEDAPTVAERLLDLVGLKSPRRPCAVLGDAVYQSCADIPKGRFNVTDVSASIAGNNSFFGAGENPLHVGAGNVVFPSTWTNDMAAAWRARNNVPGAGWPQKSERAP